MLFKRMFRTVLVIASLSVANCYAAVPLLGWGYSLGNAAWRIAPWDDDGAGWWDPPAETIYSGRVTLQFDPSYYQIKTFGWFGGFGFDPSIPAPAVRTDNFTPDPVWAATWILQQPNGGLVKHTVTIDNVKGFLVTEFDWGAAGFNPASVDHFNFFGYTYSLPAGMTNAQLQANTTGAYGPGKMAIIGSAQDVALNGTNATTYMLCGGGYCGAQAVPEPSGVLLFVSGFAGVFALFTFRRQTNSQAKEPA